MVKWVARNVRANPHLKDHVVVRALDWDDPAHFEALPCPQPVDIVLGADLTYDIDAHKVLLQALQRLSGPNTTIVLSHDDASTPACPAYRKAFFEDLLPRHGLEVKPMNPQQTLQNSGFDSPTVHVFHIRNTAANACRR